MKKIFLYFILYACIIIGLCKFSMHIEALAGVSYGDHVLQPSIPINKEIVWTEEMEKQRLEAMKPKEVKKVPPKVEKPQEKPKEVKPEVKEMKGLDIDKLAKAVAVAETGNCTKGYGKTHNNCHGIKSGNTYPCPGTPKGKMCKFKTTEESFKAFKVIWQRWYKIYPTPTLAKRWTGGDKHSTWMKHVNLHYNKQ